jgi:ATP-binding cassette subfamily B protein/subfamily B ATP-binding cassette protein MsbA
MELLVRAWQFYRDEARAMGQVLLLITGAALLSLLKPWPLAWIVDEVLVAGTEPHFDLGPFGIVNRRAELLALLAGALVLIHVLHGSLAAAHNYASIRVGLAGLRRVREEVFTALHRLSMRFHSGAKAGDLVQRAAWDTYAFQTLFQQGAVTTASALLSLALMVVFMARTNGVLTLIALLAAPLLWFVMREFGRPLAERGAEAQQADSNVTSAVQQSLAAMPLTQGYTLEEHQARQFRTQTFHAQERRLSQHGWEVLYWLAVTVVFGLVTALLTWAGAHQVMKGTLTVGELLVFLAYLAQLYEPVNQLAHVGSTVSTAGAAANRVFEILDMPGEVKDAPDARPVVRQAPVAVGGVARPTGRTQQIARNSLFVRGTLEFDKVSFAYDARPVLQDVSFAVPAGESIAILGPSGVGKTTLLNLVTRFFDPALGFVKLDGADVRTVRLRDLRAQVAIVLQEPVLLPTTIYENIACGRPGATRAEVIAAATAANAHLFIEQLHARYNTVVGDGGMKLSVGERQRINLARAFLKDAPVLLLDEPTSALDAESESLVVEALHALMAHRTTLIVAHRLTTIRRVNRIVVLEGGRVTETGTPEELLAKGGYYARVAGGQAATE